jgi:hypothetical protein
MRERQREKARGREALMLTVWLECGRAFCLLGCAHPLHRSDRKRERERERERERGRERVWKRGRDKEREGEKESEKDVEYGYRLYFIAFNNGRIVSFIFKRNDGCFGNF